jgi:hypothetical protein
MNRLLTCGIIVVNGLVPRGPGMGCHVAPCFGCLKFLWSPWDSNPGPPHICKVFAKSALPMHHTMLLIIYMF